MGGHEHESLNPNKGAGLGEAKKSLEMQPSGIRAQFALPTQIGEVSALDTGDEMGAIGDGGLEECKTPEADTGHEDIKGRRFEG